MLKNYDDLSNEIRMLEGNINRMCVTKDDNELERMFKFAKSRLDDIYTYNKSRVDELEKTEEPEVKEKIRCNWCFWVGGSDELIVDKDDDEICPNCKEQGYLMDIK